MKTNKGTILIIEDDQPLASLIANALQKEGYLVFMEHQGDQAVSKIEALEPDLIILDLMLPFLNGIEICRMIRDDYNGCILILTAREGDVDQIAGLEAGADDYVIKPIKPKVLIARVNSHFRRMNTHIQANLSSVLLSSGLMIDLHQRSARVFGQRVDLTTSEFDLLAYLAHHAGQTLSRQDLYQALRGIDYDGVDRSIDLRVSKIRRYLKNAGLQDNVIKTVHGRGYHFISLPFVEIPPHQS